MINKLKGKLIVSCQSVEGEPLNDKNVVAKLANACVIGGAEFLRLSQKEHILEAKKLVNVPTIGLIKNHYEDSDVFITATIKEVEDLVETGVEVIAIDATLRKRPGNQTLDEFVKEIKSKFPKQLLMADCSDYDDVVNADKLGFDLIGTTLRGYTKETINKSNLENNYEFIRNILKTTKTPIIAEGGIWNPHEARDLLDIGVHAVVVGSAITRPHLIVEHWLKEVFK